MRGDEFERSISYGERALTYLRKNATPAYPQNYELWYTYTSGINPNLNAAVDQALESKGRLKPQDIEDLYDSHLSPVRLRDRLGEVSSDVTSKINEVLALLESSEKNVGGYGDTLRAASNGLGNAKTQAQARSIVERIIAATQEIEAKNAELEHQLSESRAQIEGLHDSLEVIRFESRSDQLTGLANRKAFDESLEQAIEAANAERRSLCLTFCDIDHFKKFNDTFGHQTGDQVLRLVGAAIRAYAAPQDIPARYGGEEFAIIMVDTDLQNAVRRAEQVRYAVAEKELVKKSTGESLGHVTMSAGVTSYARGEPLESFVERADQLLYEAKNAGRNRVISREGDLRGDPTVQVA